MHRSKGPSSHLVNDGGPQKLFPQRKAPAVETRLEGYAFKAALDEHINIGSVAFILYPSPTAPTATATSYTHSNILINHLLTPMRKFIPHVSSSHGSDSSNATQYTPNTCKYMGRFRWPQPSRIPFPGSYYPYGVSANGMHSAPPAYAPVALSPGVGAGFVDHAFQTGQNGYFPPPGADVSCATYGGPYSLPTAAAHPPQDPSATPLYHQPISFPGAANPYAALVPHQGYLHQNHGSVLATGSAFSSLPQAPRINQKHVVEHLHYHDVKQAKIAPGGMKNDPLFTPVLDRLGQPNGTFVCSRDGMVLNPGSYLKHLKTKKHLGFKLEKFKCSGCPKTYTRRDAYKRHLINSKCGQSTAVDALLPYSASQNSTSSASAAPAMAPTTALTHSHLYSSMFAEDDNNDDTDF
ncbi:uncharacterized protein HD556DRAFT_460541 [Suillus plorans]|uniref:C2H2-type domain-containing protein n=1 Tax=Suillus plorans TaxID=116603 RepID=A0A9P7ARL1_9AGAM|nr:uncharacterized protein HD556DRAFT_460541 [Suillus plorans]KAG1793976.1 hypothetical protein HD556DRAFT_460541 [Suillus plorans]